MMIRKNTEYYNELLHSSNLDILCNMTIGDARDTKWASKVVLLQKAEPKRAAPHPRPSNGWGFLGQVAS